MRRLDRVIVPVRLWLEELCGPGPIIHSPRLREDDLTALPLSRIRRITLADEVCRTLFDEYAAHRLTERRKEETGWVLLGYRSGDEATVVVTLPAGTNRDAGESHVQFDWEAQVLASRIVRQDDRRLTMLGIVHTHPGRLRTPSAGDLNGDRDWVANLRGQEGVFGIGTVASEFDQQPEVQLATQPKPNVLCYGPLRFDWYTLAAADANYQRVPVALTLGPDLAISLRSVWETIETHAARLERLAERFRKVRFDIGVSNTGPAVSMTMDLDGNGERARIVLQGKTVRFFHEPSNGPPIPFDLPVGTNPDHGIYLLLAELAARR